MARKNRVSVPDGIYHVTARVANRAMLLAKEEVKDKIVEWIVSVADFRGVGKYVDGDPEAIVKSIKPWYDGYCFAREKIGEESVFNSDMVLSAGTRLHCILYQFKGTELIRLEEFAP